MQINEHYTLTDREIKKSVEIYSEAVREMLDIDYGSISSSPFDILLMFFREKWEGRGMYRKGYGALMQIDFQLEVFKYCHAAVMTAGFTTTDVQQALRIDGKYSDEYLAEIEDELVVDYKGTEVTVLYDTPKAA